MTKDLIARVEAATADEQREVWERWPGYYEQSWQQRFQELDRRYGQSQGWVAKLMNAALRARGEA